MARCRVHPRWRGEASNEMEVLPGGAVKNVRPSTRTVRLLLAPGGRRRRRRPRRRAAPRGPSGGRPVPRRFAAHRPPTGRCRRVELRRSGAATRDRTARSGRVAAATHEHRCVGPEPGRRSGDDADRGSNAGDGNEHDGPRGAGASCSRERCARSSDARRTDPRSDRRRSCASVMPTIVPATSPTKAAATAGPTPRRSAAAPSSRIPPSPPNTRPR